MSMIRIGTFGSCLGTFLGSEFVPCIFKVDRMICLVIVIPLDNCKIVKYIQRVFAVIALPATSLLFFFSPQGRLLALEDYYHYLRNILASYRWSEYFTRI